LKKSGIAMFQESEIINLALAVFSSVIIVIIFLRRRLPELSFFHAGFFCIVAANSFTVLEGFFWGQLLNGLEHFCYAAAGFCFAAGGYRMSKSFER